MDAEERPAKLRKLNSDDDLGLAEDADADASYLSNLPGTRAVTGTVDAPSLQNSKPEECAANLQDPSVPREEEDVRDESDDGLGSNPENQPDFAHTAPPQEQQQQNGDAPKPLSKNQLKKLRKREEWEAARDYRKAKRKQKTQEKRARRRAAREEELEQHRLQVVQQQPSLVSEENGQVEGTKSTKSPIPPPPQPSSKMKYRRPVQIPMTILIDCGFDDLMMEKERISLGSQLTRSYSDNTRARYQAHLVISSWGGLLKERFDTVLSKHYLNWRNVTFVEGDFVEAANKAEELMRGRDGGKLAGCFEKYAAAAATTASADGSGPAEEATHQNLKAADVSLQSEDVGKFDADSLPQPQEPSAPKAPNSATQPGLPHSSSSPPDPSFLSPHPKGEVIYLTSDSPDTLTTLSPYSTYIIGGLVDKNRHKGICYKTAAARGIKTAKLPIGEYLEMTSRKVLATNHVVEILLRYLEEEDWGKAFLRVIPKRKGGKLRGENAGAGAGEEEEEDGNAKAVEEGDEDGDDAAEDANEDDDDSDGADDVHKEQQRTANGEQVPCSSEPELSEPPAARAGAGTGTEMNTLP
ncbi:uncharacterized protein Z520_01435 [Fonsecaea multimorphosa CBS 102226]|uniref:tRNA (guanine(9)-N1)-methyltransferase n=1 Tax=Fonsecaea multimorphosa CBS 102226 TaxID=1442371 RepID=A0A0D2KHR1_9EURO|nr:uncharacterized protein Z520_01435 [Fonsecaea multimorphosa CBS 102226]KIY02970.1 hypothetical protein Z520_01435 [Fonsecaea multimorphosa CBS 102226]OAL30801.1 hypothetical protein AYO22_01421 [Fonsecaea multimorphosa]